MPPNDVTIVTATGLEARAVRRHAPASAVVEAGVALKFLARGRTFAAAISVGLAGGLNADLPTGTVVIPDLVAQTNGTMTHCDQTFTSALRESAATLGIAYVTAPLLTSATLIIGNGRERWAREGYAAVDMESAFIPATRLAVVRVVLDTPLRELSPDWLNPLRAFLRPGNWSQAAWLAREGPRCADLAARVVAAALERA
ncbi:MAG TPA: hypothetical protein VIK27_00355 [Candidatus Aquilonibacter sp.]